MSRRKIITMTAVSAAAVIVSLIFGIGCGSVFIPPDDIIKVIFDAIFKSGLSADIPQSSATIILSVRMPRVLLAFLTGAALAVSGATVQSVLNNPLASPFTLGVSSGASLGASIAIAADIAVFGAFTLAFSGLASAIITMLFMVTFAKKLDRSLQSSTVVLTGMVLSLFISSIVSLIANVSDDKYKQIMKWQTGSFAGRGWEYDGMLAIMLAVGLIYLMFSSRKLDMLNFGDEQAQSAGLDTKKHKMLLLIAASILSGTAVAFAGVIGFIDLISPHIARKLFGAKHSILIPMSAVTGGVFTVICDLIARTVIPPNELPVGVVTSLIGAPFFAYVYFRRRTEKI